MLNAQVGKSSPLSPLFSLQVRTQPRGVFFGGGDKLVALGYEYAIISLYLLARDYVKNIAVMNRLILLAVAGFALVGCTSSYLPEPEAEQAKAGGQIANPFERSPEEAISVVQDFLSQGSEFRTTHEARSVDRLVQLEQVSGFRSTSDMQDFASKFYAVEFKDSKGYAIVSKDLRTFPIFAVLDSGRVNSQALNTGEMKQYRDNMLTGFDSEVESYNRALAEAENSFRMHSGSASENRENAIQKFLADGWRLTRQTGVRLTSFWGQNVDFPNIVMNPFGASYFDVHERPNPKDFVDNPFAKVGLLPKSFGCTPVAFGQVMYALRNEAGFRDLKYPSGEPILWNFMSDYSLYNKECQRFLGWITTNCSPTIFGDQTMVFNINATKFLRKIIGDNIKSRYDNCIVGDGDFDGYGWSEDKRIAEEFFQYPKCFVIMTASSGALNYVDYHTFVIDGMVEFHKRMKGSGFLGTGLFRKWRNGVRHLYHINAGWNGASNGYFLYVQSVNDEFKYTGSNDALDYRSKVAYLIVRPS